LDKMLVVLTAFLTGLTTGEVYADELEDKNIKTLLEKMPDMDTELIYKHIIGSAEQMIVKTFENHDVLDLDDLNFGKIWENLFTDQDLELKLPGGPEVEESSPIDLQFLLDPSIIGSDFETWPDRAVDFRYFGSFSKAWDLDTGDKVFQMISTFPLPADAKKFVERYKPSGHQAHHFEEVDCKDARCWSILTGGSGFLVMQRAGSIVNSVQFFPDASATSDIDKIRKNSKILAMRLGRVAVKKVQDWKKKNMYYMGFKPRFYGPAEIIELGRKIGKYSDETLLELAHVFNENTKLLETAVNEKVRDIVKEASQKKEL